VPSGPLVNPARSAIFRIAVCTPASACSSAFSVTSLSLTTSGAMCCSTLDLITATSASVRPLKNGGAPRTADDAASSRQPTSLNCTVHEPKPGLFTGRWNSNSVRFKLADPKTLDRHLSCRKHFRSRTR